MLIMIETPTIKNVLRDGERNVVYEVIAYRTLTRAELLAAVRQHLTMHPLPRRGTRRSIITTIR